MTLKNLLGISLDVAQADKIVVARLLAAAERNIADAQLQPQNPRANADCGLCQGGYSGGVAKDINHIHGYGQLMVCFEHAILTETSELEV